MEFNIQPGQSLCLLYQKESEKQQVLRIFIRSSHALGHRVTCLVSDPHDLSLLDSFGIDPGHTSANGHPASVRLQAVQSVFFSTGLDGMNYLAWLHEETTRAKLDGFSGLDLIIDMAWASNHSPHQLNTFETCLQQNLKNSSILGLTLYDLAKFSPERIMHMLTAHPLVIFKEEIKRNPFHIPESMPAAEIAFQTWLDYLGSSSAPHGHLPESGERLQMIMASMPVVVFSINRQGIFTLSEGKGLAALGLRSGEMVGLNAFESFSDVKELNAMLQRTLMGETFSIDVNVNGTIFETHCSPLHDGTDEIEGMLGVAVDITDRRQAEESLRASEERYRLLVENQGEGAGIFGPDGQVVYINGAAEGILGVPVDELVGRNIGEFVPPDQMPVFAQQISSRKTGQVATYEIAFMRRDGRRRQVLVTATPRYDAAGSYLGSFSIFRDITDRKKIEDRLRYQSNHDSLTGLYNRAYFDETINEHNRKSGTPVGVVVVDVDGLKEINDHHGHLTGDEHLRRIARLMRSSFRSEDIVARIGGDEFAVILPNCDQRILDLSIIRLRKNLVEINQRAHDFPLEISVGGAILEPGQSLMRTFDLADQRMYLEKFSRRKKD